MEQRAEDVADWSNKNGVFVRGTEINIDCQPDDFDSLPRQVFHRGSYYNKSHYQTDVNLAWYRESPKPPPEEVATGKPFDQAALETMKEAAQRIIAQHPEIRSVVVVLDYKGPLNDAQVDKGLWIGENGPVNRLDAMFGSLANTSRVLEQMFLKVAATEQQMRDEAAVLGTELTKRRAAIAEPSTTPPATGQPDSPRPDISAWPDQIWVSEGGSVRVANDIKASVLGQVSGNQLHEAGYALREYGRTARGHWWKRGNPFPFARKDAAVGGDVSGDAPASGSA